MTELSPIDALVIAVLMQMKSNEDTFIHQNASNRLPGTFLGYGLVLSFVAFSIISSERRNNFIVNLHWFGVWFRCSQAIAVYIEPPVANVVHVVPDEIIVARTFHEFAASATVKFLAIRLMGLKSALALTRSLKQQQSICRVLYMAKNRIPN